VRDEVSDWIGDKTQYKAHYKHESEQGYFLFAYVASYMPLTTALMTNKNSAQILDGYLFPGALSCFNHSIALAKDSVFSACKLRAL
jgi:hypothetical protein